jgi:hypothetical protein
MRTRFNECGVMRRGRRRRRMAVLPLALIALLTTLLPAAIASAHTAAPQASGVRAAVIEVPTGGLTNVLSGVPVSELGLSNGQLGTLLSGLGGGALAGQSGTLTALVGTLLGGDSQATLGQLAGAINGNPVLHLLLGSNLSAKQLIGGLNSEQLQTLLTNFTADAGAGEVEQVLASLAGGSLGGEQLAALKSIVGALTGALSGEGLTKLREDLRALPTGLSPTELAQLTPAQLAETVVGLFASATPTQLQPVVVDLLGELSWGAGTAGSLAGALGVPLETLAGSLGESAQGGFSTLPVVSGALGDTGGVMSLVDRTRGLAVGLLEGEPEEGAGGGSGGSGSGGSGSGSGGSGSGGGSGSSAGGGAGGGSSSGAGAGGSGTGNPGAGGSGANGGSKGSANNSGGEGDVTVTLLLPPTPGAPGSASRSAVSGKSGKFKLLRWRRRGRIATIVLQTPGAGTLTLSGADVKTTTAHLRKGGTVTLTATLAKARMAALLRGHQRLRVRLKATFKPLKGAASRVAVTIPFA